MNKKVSVIMSVYNNEKTLENSIKSVLNQTYKNIELLVIDDCSLDNTPKLLKDFSLKYKIKAFFNEKNVGLTKNLNFLISQSDGQLIARQDGDDYSHLQRLEKQINALTKYNLDAVTTRATNLSTGNPIPNIKYYLPKKLLMKYLNPHIHGTLVVSKDVLYQINLYDEKFIYAQDYRLMIELYDKNFKVKQLKEELYFLNTVDNISNKFKAEQNYYAECARKKIIPETDTQ